MALADESVCREAFSGYNLGTKVAVANVVGFTETVKFRGITEYDTYVMDNGGVFDKYGVYAEIWTTAYNIESFTGHVAAMLNDQFLGFRVIRIMSVYDFQAVHFLFIINPQI
jgi:hypothetical protein